MSRAFVSENDSQFEEEEVPAIKIPLPPGARNYTTPAGAEALRAELEELVQNEKPRLSAQISRSVSGGATAPAAGAPAPAAGAAGGGEADGDTLSRLRRRLREVERRVEYLTAMSSRLEVVEGGGQEAGRVAFGATVKVREAAATATSAGSAAVETYRIVGVDESDPAGGAISWISPLARALVSARLGDVVTVRLPDGERRLEILAIEHC